MFLRASRTEVEVVEGKLEGIPRRMDFEFSTIRVPIGFQDYDKNFFKKRKGNGGLDQILEIKKLEMFQEAVFCDRTDYFSTASTVSIFKH